MAGNGYEKTFSVVEVVKSGTLCDLVIISPRAARMSTVERAVFKFAIEYNCSLRFLARKKKTFPQTSKLLNDY